MMPLEHSERVVLGALVMRADDVLRAEVKLAEIALETGLGHGTVLLALAAFDAREIAAVEVSPDADRVVAWLRPDALAELTAENLVHVLRAWRGAWAAAAAIRWTASA